MTPPPKGLRGLSHRKKCRSVVSTLFRCVTDPCAKQTQNTHAHEGLSPESTRIHTGPLARAAAATEQTKSSFRRRNLLQAD